MLRICRNFPYQNYFVQKRYFEKCSFFQKFLKSTKINNKLSITKFKLRKFYKNAGNKKPFNRYLEQWSTRCYTTSNNKNNNDSNENDDNNNNNINNNNSNNNRINKINPKATIPVTAYTVPLKSKEILVLHIPSETKIEKISNEYDKKKPWMHTYAAEILVPTNNNKNNNNNNKSTSEDENENRYGFQVISFSTLDINNMEKYEKKIMLVPITFNENKTIPDNLHIIKNVTEMTPRSLSSSEFTSCTLNEIITRDDQKNISIKMPIDHNVPISAVKLELDIEMPNIAKIIANYFKDQQKSEKDQSAANIVSKLKSANDLHSKAKSKTKNFNYPPKDCVIPVHFKTQAKGVLSLNIADIKSQDLDSIDFNKILTDFTSKVLCTALEKGYKINTNVEKLDSTMKSILSKQYSHHSASNDLNNALTPSEGSIDNDSVATHSNLKNDDMLCKISSNSSTTETKIDKEFITLTNNSNLNKYSSNNIEDSLGGCEHVSSKMSEFKKSNYYPLCYENTFITFNDATAKKNPISSKYKEFEIKDIQSELFFSTFKKEKGKKDKNSKDSGKKPIDCSHILKKKSEVDKTEKTDSKSSNVVECSSFFFLDDSKKCGSGSDKKDTKVDCIDFSKNKKDSDKKDSKKCGSDPGKKESKIDCANFSKIKIKNSDKKDSKKDDPGKKESKINCSAFTKDKKDSKNDSKKDGKVDCSSFLKDKKDSDKKIDCSSSSKDKKKEGSDANKKDCSSILGKKDSDKKDSKKDGDCIDFSKNKKDSGPDKKDSKVDCSAFTKDKKDSKKDGKKDSKIDCSSFAKDKKDGDKKDSKKDGAGKKDSNIDCAAFMKNKKDSDKKDSKKDGAGKKDSKVDCSSFSKDKDKKKDSSGADKKDSKIDCSSILGKKDSDKKDSKKDGCGAGKKDSKIDCSAFLKDSDKKDSKKDGAGKKDSKVDCSSFSKDKDKKKGGSGADKKDSKVDCSSFSKDKDKKKDGSGSDKKDSKIDCSSILGKKDSDKKDSKKDGCGAGKKDSKVDCSAFLKDSDKKDSKKDGAGKKDSKVDCSSFSKDKDKKKGGSGADKKDSKVDCSSFSKDKDKKKDGSGSDKKDSKVDCSSFSKDKDKKKDGSGADKKDSKIDCSSILGKKDSDKKDSKKDGCGAGKKDSKVDCSAVLKDKKDSGKKDSKKDDPGKKGSKVDCSASSKDNKKKDGDGKSKIDCSSILGKKDSDKKDSKKDGDCIDFSKNKKDSGSGKKDSKIDCAALLKDKKDSDKKDSKKDDPGKKGSKVDCSASSKDNKKKDGDGKSKIDCSSILGKKDSDKKDSKKDGDCIDFSKNKKDSGSDKKNSKIDCAALLKNKQDSDKKDSKKDGCGAGKKDSKIDCSAFLKDKKDSSKKDCSASSKDDKKKSDANKSKIDCSSILGKKDSDKKDSKKDGSGDSKKDSKIDCSAFLKDKKDSSKKDCSASSKDDKKKDGAGKSKIDCSSILGKKDSDKKDSKKCGSEADKKDSKIDCSAFMKDKKDSEKDSKKDGKVDCSSFLKDKKDSDKKDSKKDGSGKKDSKVDCSSFSKDKKESDKKDSKKDGCGADGKKDSKVDCSSILGGKKDSDKKEKGCGNNNKNDNKKGKNGSDSTINCFTAAIDGIDKQSKEENIRSVKIALSKDIQIEITYAEVNKNNLNTVKNLLGNNMVFGKSPESKVTNKSAKTITLQIHGPAALNIQSQGKLLNIDELNSFLKKGDKKHYSTYVKKNLLSPQEQSNDIGDYIQSRNKIILNDNNKENISTNLNDPLRVDLKTNSSVFNLQNELSNLRDSSIKKFIIPEIASTISADVEKGTKTSGINSKKEELKNSIVRITDCKEVCLESVPVPEIGDYDVLIKVDSVAISGSDLYMYESGAKTDCKISLGHDVTGIIEKVGKCVNHLKVGNKVAIEAAMPCKCCDICKLHMPNLCPDTKYNGHFSKYSVHPAEYCHLLPDSCNLENGTLVHILTRAIHAIQSGHVSKISNVLILGVCPIGLCCLMYCKILEVPHIQVIGGTKKYIDKACEIGGADNISLINDDLSPNEIAECILNSSPDQKPPDVIICCSGGTKYLNVAVLCSRPGATCVIAGCQTECATHNILEAYMKELKIVSSFRSFNLFPVAIGLLDTNKINVSPLITHHFCLSCIDKAFKTALDEDGKEDAIKVIVKCQVEKTEENNKKDEHKSDEDQE